MRQDLDRIMQERGLAGMIVLAEDRYSPAMHYVTGQKIHRALYLRAADGRAHLAVDPMERDQAEQAGVEFSTLPQQGFNRYQEEEKHLGRAYGRLAAEMCSTMGVRGRVAFLGDAGAGFAHTMLERTLQLNPQLSVDTSWPDLLSAARNTKDEREAEAIRRAGLGTAAAMNRLREHLASLRRDGDRFFAEGGRPVTLGDLRRFLHRQFLEHGLAEDGESIVAQGRDAGVPHNRGNDADELRPGTPILVDIFPGEAGGGYHADMTRTWCLGPAPGPLRKLYDEVHEAFRAAMDTLAVGQPCRSYQDRVCQVFEGQGHPTQRTNEGTEEGYVHSLGHGVGLTVHEGPRLGGPPSNTQVIEPGMVITIEPGLYYPSRGLGVRIEDTVLVRPDGTFENLTPAPYDLEIGPAD